jgi:predicted RNA polymerase sigma factor
VALIERASAFRRPGRYQIEAMIAALLRELGHSDEAAREDAMALALTRNTGERALLEERLAGSCRS